MAHGLGGCVQVFKAEWPTRLQPKSTGSVKHIVCTQQLDALCKADRGGRAGEISRRCAWVTPRPGVGR